MTLHNQRSGRSSPTPPHRPRLPGLPTGHHPIKALQTAATDPRISDAAFRFYAVVVLTMPACKWHTVDDMAERADLTNYRIRGYLGQLVDADLLMARRSTVEVNGTKRERMRYQAVTPR